MKKSYIFFLVGILSICNGVFSAETGDVPAEITEFRKLYAQLEKQVEKLKEEGASTKTIEKYKVRLIFTTPSYGKIYGQAAEIKIPDSIPGKFTIFHAFPTERDQQKEVRDTLRQAAKEFETDNQLEEALQIYKYAPTTFETEIVDLEKTIKTKEDDFMAIAIEADALKAQGKYAEASAKLKEIINDPSQLPGLIKQAEDDLAEIQEAQQAPEQALISALQNLKNGFEQLKGQLG